MTPDPESLSWVRLLIAVAVIAGLLAGFGFVLKYLKNRGLIVPGLASRPSTTRLEIVETLPLDMRRKLVIVRCDSEEHLLLLGANQDIVVQNNLRTSPTTALQTKSHS